MNEPTGYTPLDLVGYTDRGDYDPTATYVKNDLVNSGDTKWRCKVDDTIGVTPTEGVNWTAFIQLPADTTKQIIAPVEVTPSQHAYQVGKQLIFNSTLYTVTSPIAVNDALVVGTNIQASDTVIEQVEDNASEIGDVWSTMAKNGAHNYLENTGTTKVDGSVTFTVTTSGDNKGMVNANGTAGSSGARFDFVGNVIKAGQYIAHNSTDQPINYQENGVVNHIIPANSKALITWTQDIECRVIWDIPATATVSNKKFYPMLTAPEDTNPNFAPYAKTNGELTKDVTSLQNCKYHTHESGTKTINCTNSYQQFIMTIFKGSSRAVYLITQFSSTATYKELVYITSGQTEPTITVTNTGDKTFTISLPSSTQTNIYCTEPFTVS